MVISKKNSVEIFNLTEEILKEHPNGYYMALIWGKKGRGKTAYCIHTAKQLFMELSKLPDNLRYEKLEPNITIEEAYNMALDHMAFTIPDIVNMTREAKGALINPVKMIPVIIWDDAGVGGSSYLGRTELKISNVLKGYNDILRRRITGFLVNTPVTKGLLSFIRNEEDLGVPIIKCTKEERWNRLATARVKREESRFRFKVFEDAFSCYLPKWVYEKYVRIADEAFDRQADLVDAIIADFESRYITTKEPAPYYLKKPSER